MIHAPRTAPGPRTLRSNQAAGARAEVTSFFKRPLHMRRQQTPQFSRAVLAAGDVQAALTELFHGKCAYCESVYAATMPTIVDQFRPTFGALDLDGKSHPDHYWWLAYAWENLYAICIDCRRRKGRRFPVSGARARPGETGKALRREGAVLLDPCLDDPEKHLVYDDDGHVSSGTETGRITIEVLGLDRAMLVRARRRALDGLQLEWNVARSAIAQGGSRADRQLSKLLDARLEYAGIRRQFTRMWIDKETTGARVLERASKGPVGKVGVVSPLQQEMTRQDFEAFRSEAQSYSVAAEEAEGYFIATRWIRSIEIRNFRVIGDLRLDFPSTPPSGETPWLMLLGENGSGKSSVLQAMALALMGDAYRNRLELPPVSTLIRHGKSSAFVAVELDGAPDPIELHIGRRSRRIRASEADPKVLLLAYGATRLLPRGNTAAGPVTSFANVDNLFNPFVPLKDPSAWLMTLDKERFDAVARALKGLLPLGEEGVMMRRGGRVEVQAFGARVSLAELSDGYQSVVALVTDIMQVLLHRWDAMEVAEGIVAVDELEAHLHPRWRMRIVGSLRKVFPRVQFIATTHDPLCIRGLFDGEVTVMRRTPEHEVFADTDLPLVQGLRVDQILTSEAFGLNSTSDPEVDELLDKYRALRWRSKQTPAVRRERAKLRARLDELQALGRDRRERLVLEAADEYLATEEITPDRGERRELKDKTKKKLAEIFAEPVREAERRR